MSLFKGVSIRFKHLVRKYICTFIRDLLPNRTKRLIFISTLIASIRDNTHPSDDEIRKINKLFDLSSKDSAISLPTYFAKLLWGNNIFEEVFLPCANNVNNLKDLQFCNIRNSELRLIVDRLLYKVPNWLSYGEPVMTKDIGLIIKKIPQLELT